MGGRFIIKGVEGFISVFVSVKFAQSEQMYYNAFYKRGTLIPEWGRLKLPEL
jgi:hypothetical protein